ncbi:VOC family protein [Novosphingobium sp.]|uniref:VOC family protein n=1 Tax=Novosphingobium sp. TaxID=1874826 RepID=UPI00333FA670
MTIKARRAAIDQIGMVTTDLDRAVAVWTDRFGVGPWVVYRQVVLNGEYRGAPTRVCMDVALGYRGTEQIELIAVRSDTASPYQDADGRALTGLHHVAWIVDDIDAEAAALADQGLEPVFFATNPAVRVIYFADPAEPGILFELISGATARHDHRAGMALAAAWDGTNPVTEIDLSHWA